MKTFIILGMHRSATSLVAEGISSMVDMGSDLSSPNYENQDIKKLNQQILRGDGGKWDNPPPLIDINTTYDYTLEIETVLSMYDKKHNLLIGWKDPRTTLTIQYWIPHIHNPHFICCYREPLEVAKSLQKRNGFTIEKGLKLAKIYNNRIKSFMDDWLKYE